jgi:hypothetical protein
LSKTSKEKQAPQENDADIVDAEVVHEESATPQPEDLKIVTEKPAALDKNLASKSGWIIAGLLAAFMGGVYAAPQFKEGMVSLGLRNAPPPPMPTGQQVDIAPLEATIADLQATVTAQREALAQQYETSNVQKAALEQLQSDVALLAGRSLGEGRSEIASADVSAIKAELERLTTDIARLSALSSDADPAVAQINGALALARAENAQLSERLNILESAVKAYEAGALEGSPRGRLVLSLGRMKDKAMAGQPYGADLAGLRTDLAALPALDQQLMGAEIASLDRIKEGVTPFVTLVRDFDPAVAAAIRAGDKADGGFLQGLFTARRTDGGAAGDDAVFLQAERRLTARDVEGALASLAGLEGAVAVAMQPWSDAAQAYVTANSAFDRLIKATANAGQSSGGSQ